MRERDIDNYWEAERQTETKIEIERERQIDKKQRQPTDRQELRDRY